MKRRCLSIFIRFLLLAIVCAAAAFGLYAETTGTTGAKKALSRLPESMSKLPSESQFVFGINMKKIAATPSLASFRQAVIQQMGKDLSDFIARTGIDPSRDIEYILGAGRSDVNANSRVAFILLGKFDSNAVAEFLKAKVSPIEVKYAGATVLMIPDKQSDAAETGFALLGDREILAGDLGSIKSILDVSEKKNKGILSNLSMAPLINALDPEEMLWVVGDVSKLSRDPKALPQSLPIAPMLASIKTVTGALNVVDSVSGKIIANADSADSALKMAEAIKAIIAIGQLTGPQPPAIKRMLSGLTVTTTATRVRINLTMPIDMLPGLVSAFAPAQ
jgi:hypothetical protein